MSQSTLSAAKPALLARLRAGAAENPTWVLTQATPVGQSYGIKRAS